MFSRLPRARRAAFLLLSAVAVGTLSACDTPSAPATQETNTLQTIKGRAWNVDTTGSSDTSGSGRGGFTDPHGRTMQSSGFTDPHG